MIDKDQTQMEADGYLEIEFKDGETKKFPFKDFEEWVPHPAGVLIHDKNGVRIYPWHRIEEVFSKHNSEEYVEWKTKQAEKGLGLDSSTQPGEQTGQYI